MKSLILPALVLVCLTTPASSETISEADRARVEREVRQAVVDYVEAVKAKDLPRILSFWGDFDDFVHAGDGRIFGDHDKWTSWLKENTKNTDEWLYWNNTDIHVAVLAQDAAAYTTNFENSYVEDGETHKVTGSWTYVLRKTEAGWQVVHSNGHHIGFSYDE